MLVRTQPKVKIEMRKFVWPEIPVSPLIIPSRCNIIINTISRHSLFIPRIILFIIVNSYIQYKQISIAGPDVFQRILETKTSKLMIKTFCYYPNLKLHYFSAQYLYSHGICAYKITCLFISLYWTIVTFTVNVSSLMI